MKNCLNQPAPPIPADLRQYYIVVNDRMIQHPILPDVRGTLIKSMKTGNYRIYCNRRNYSCSNLFGKEHDTTL